MPRNSQLPDCGPNTTIQDGSLLLGIGRSGTTFLTDLLCASSTPMRVVLEPLPRVVMQPEVTGSCERWYVPPDPQSASYRWARSTLSALKVSCESIRKELRRATIRRDDYDASTLIVKEVHGALAAPMLIEDLGWRVVAITRDTTRVIDSYFVGHTRRQRTYLVDEAALVRRLLQNPALVPDRIREIWQLTLDMVSRDTIRYLRRPIAISSELMRQTCVTHFVSTWLIAWASLDKHVRHVQYEDLCRQPVEETVRILEFLGLDHDSDTLARIGRQSSQGASTDYYSTDKNSMSMLTKPFSYLGPAKRRQIAKRLNLL